MENVTISYGSGYRISRKTKKPEENLVAIIHPSSNPKEDIGNYMFTLPARIYVTFTSVKAVSEVFEDFLLNTHKYLKWGGFVGLRNRCRDRYGIESEPCLTGLSDEFHTQVIKEIYPGLVKYPLNNNQVGYVIKGHHGLNLGAFLPNDFELKARELALNS